MAKTDMKDMITMTIGQMVEYQAKMHPDNDGLVAPLIGVRYSYQQFDEECDKIAKAFLAIGIKRGDHIAIWSTNYPQWVITQVAASKIGAVLVTVNTAYKRFELEYLLRQSDSSTLITMQGLKDSNYIQHIMEICPEIAGSRPGELCSEALPRLKRVIYLDEQTPDGMLNWKQLDDFAEQVSDEQLAQAKAQVDIHDVANMQYTSGTTGFPKGVMLTHFNLLNNGKGIGDCMKFTDRDRLLIHVPLFHCFGAVLGVMSCITHGTTIVLNDHFNPVHALQVIQAEKCTAVHGVPTMFISMLNVDGFENYDLSSLRTGIMAGSPCPIELMRRAIDEMGMREITITYGLTEASPAITMTTTDDSVDIRVNTIGKAMPHVEVKIVDPETGEECPDGVPGEIMSRGYNTMKGYYNMPEATAQAIEPDGWLHTGDIGTRDASGYYKVTGRLKDMIIRGGENIYPRELEEFLYTHECVQDVQVIGVPDEKYGEEVMACVILKPGVPQPSEEEMIEFVKNGLSRFKAPRYVRFVDGFPMNAAGKIQKFKMREWAVQELGLGEAASIETA